jgi:hypothetical protein
MANYEDSSDSSSGFFLVDDGRLGPLEEEKEGEGA